MTAEDDARGAAEGFRREHHLGTQPLGDLVALIEQTTGIDVAVLDVGPDEHGLTMRDPARGAVFIAVARTEHPMRQRSTLAHELAHVLFEDWTDEQPTDSVPRPYKEIRADAFARHLLVPGAGVREVVGDAPATPLVLSKLVQWFQVSPAVAAIAMYQAGLLDSGTKELWMTISTPKLAARFGWTDQYKALQQQSDRRRAPQKLLARAIEGYVENVVSAQALATLRGIEAAAVIRELTDQGIEQQASTVVWEDVGDLPDVEFGDADGDVDEGPAG
ncbi:ImmA/IrrE family metallo-endopeptidase [Rhodococcus sp. NPDC057529]|uniref:ImmA/IrrE family metallo-endopeptidase n=1 Tax=Rhodococcus sp. NPDC057529 TaxID=3346158 RepID=UPI00366AAF43